MSIVAKALRLAAAVLNTAADLRERNETAGRTAGARYRQPGVAPDFSAATAQERAAQRFNERLAQRMESARQTDLLIGMSQRMMQARNRRTWESLRSINPCPHCDTFGCSCR